MREHPVHRPSPVDLVRSRREALRAAAALGLASALAHLTGCGSTPKRGGSLGDPIPPDPVLHRTSRPYPRSSYPAPTSPVASGAPRIFHRSEWTKAPPKPWLADPMNGIRRITVHHDAVHPQPSLDLGSSVNRLDSIRRGHLGRGWADIGYHYAIDPSGRIWACRPLELQGAHVADQNPHNLGIMVMGNFDRATPTPAAQRALADLIAWEMRRFGVRVNEVRTHQEMASTACPGRNLQGVMNSLRSGGGTLTRV